MTDRSESRVRFFGKSFGVSLSAIDADLRHISRRLWTKVKGDACQRAVLRRLFLFFLSSLSLFLFFSP